MMSIDAIEKQPLRRSLAAVSLVLLLLVGCSDSNDDDTTPSTPDPVTDPQAAMSELPCYDQQAVVGMHSSFSRPGLNTDFLTVTDPIPHQRPYLYRDDQGRYVLLDVKGPGAIKRIWMTQLSPDVVNAQIAQGPLLESGNLQIFFDDETEPRVDMPAMELFSGETAPFLTPICGNNTVSSGGNYCYLQMPFAQRAVIAVTGRPNYWNIEYDRYESGRQVKTFDPADKHFLDAATEQQQLLMRSGSDPDILPSGKTHEDELDLPAGGSSELLALSGAGVIKGFEMILTGDAGIQDLWLEASWDGAEQPQLRAPLGDLFMSGRGEKNDAFALLSGFEVEARRGYFYFPMPFSDSAVLRVTNESDSPASLEWSLIESKDSALSKRQECGYLHAYYNEQNPTVIGEDYILMDLQEAQGKVVAITLNVDGTVTPTGHTTFLEGDERIYIDGSQTPQIYGTGMEDIFNGGFYYQFGPFTLPTHGLTAKEPSERGMGFAQYRQMLFDPWDFRNGIRIGVEHGGGNGVVTGNTSVVLWYGRSEGAMQLSDTVDVGNADSETGHAYTSGSTEVTSLQSYYSGDHDGNLSSEAFDVVIFPGAIPTLDPADQVEDDGRNHNVGDLISMRVSVDPQNQGVLVRRRMDSILFDQTAMVSVDGEPVGIWHWPVVNDLKRWADHEFVLPAKFTKGKQQIELSLEILPPIETPAISGLSIEDLVTTQVSLPTLGIFNQGGWSDFRYEIYSMK